MVLLLSQGVQRAAHLFEGRFRPGEFRLRLRDLPLGLLGCGAELGLGEPPLLQGVLPLRPLAGQCPTVPVERGDLVDQGRRRPPGRRRLHRRPGGAVARGRLPGLDLRHLHLPVDPLLARRLLLRLQVHEAGALGAELLVGAHARELALLQLALERREARLHLCQPA